MTKPYLLLNAALYGGLALWCTLKHEQTARASGFATLDNSGHSEYLVIYGGLQLGLAGFFAYMGLHEEHHRLGLLFSVLLYAPIVLYRAITVARYWPVSGLTLGIGALETALLVAGALLYFSSRSGS
jgi:hypothetical protein